MAQVDFLFSFFVQIVRFMKVIFIWMMTFGYVFSLDLTHAVFVI